MDARLISFIHFNTVQQAAHKMDVTGMIHLGNHNGVDNIADVFHHRQYILIPIRGIQCIDSDRDGFIPPCHGAQRIHDLGPGNLFCIQGHAVLHVQHDHIRLTLQGLGMHLLYMPRDR